MWRHRLVGVFSWAVVASAALGQVVDAPRMATPSNPVATSPAPATTATTTTATTTVGDVIGRVRARCEAGRMALGPFQMKVKVDYPADPSRAATTAVLLVRDHQVLAIVSGGALRGVVKLLDDGIGIHCNPIGAMPDDAARRSLQMLMLGFDCDTVADSLGLGPDTPVEVEQSEGAYYYRLDPPSEALRWIDVEDLTLAEAWTGEDGGDTRDLYNLWTEMGAGAWYPQLMERWSGGELVMRVKVEYLFSAPDLSPGVFTLASFYATDPPPATEDFDEDSW